MTEELKACPFCGSEAEYIYLENPYSNKHIVGCGNADTMACSLPLQRGTTKEKAIKAWNSRPREQELKDIIDFNFKASAENCKMYEGLLDNLKQKDTTLTEKLGKTIAENKVLKVEIEKSEWQKNINNAPKDGTEFVVAYINQGSVKQLINYNTIHKYWQSKGKPLLNLEAQTLKWKLITPQESEA